MVLVCGPDMAKLSVPRSFLWVTGSSRSPPLRSHAVCVAGSPEIPNWAWARGEARRSSERVIVSVRDRE